MQAGEYNYIQNNTEPTQYEDDVVYIINQSNWNMHNSYRLNQVFYLNINLALFLKLNCGPYFFWALTESMPISVNAIFDIMKGTMEEIIPSIVELIPFP